MAAETASSTTGPEIPKEKEEKRIIATKVQGTVKWFNVKSAYGFITRKDNGEDVFVHQSVIIKNNPRKWQRSVGDGELVEFDVAEGGKGPEACNVTGPDGAAVQGSKYAADRGRYRTRSFGRGGRNGRRTLTESSAGADGDGGSPEAPGSGQQSGRRRPPRRRPFYGGSRGGGMRGGNGGRPFMFQDRGFYRDQVNYYPPPPPRPMFPYEDQFAYRGGGIRRDVGPGYPHVFGPPMRGYNEPPFMFRDDGFGGRGRRGGRGRPMGRGRGGGRGRRGGRGSRNPSTSQDERANSNGNRTNNDN